MGNEPSSCNQESNLLNNAPLPPPPTVDAPPPPVCSPVRLAEKDHFEELHQKLLQVASSLHPGNETSLSLRQITEIISSFLPPTTAFATGGEIIFQFPAANELRITAIEVGEITISQPTPRLIHFGHYEKKQFHVKLIFDGTQFNLGFPPIPNTNSFHYKPNTMKFDVIMEIKGEKRTLNKSQNVVLGDLVVTKSTTSTPQEGTFTTSAAASSSSLSGRDASNSDEEVIQVMPMRDEHLVSTETRYSETIPASYLLQYLGTRLCTVDFSNVHHMLEIPQVPITVTACLFALRRTSNHGWVLCNINHIELNEPITVLMDGTKYLVDWMRCSINMCAINATTVDPDVQSLSLQLEHHLGTTSYTFTISRPMDRLQYVRRLATILPTIHQDLKVAPKSLGAITFSNQGQLPAISVELPRFFKQYCFVQLITSFKADAGDTLVVRDVHLHAVINWNKIRFLSVQFRKLYGATVSDVSLGLKLAPFRGQESEEFHFFHAEGLTTQALSQESISGIKKPIGNINLGQMLLDQCNFFIWKNKNHQVTAKKLNELREYTIISVSSNVSFTKCVFEITMEISKSSQRAVTSDVSTTTMTMLLDLEKMVTIISEKRLLGIELEFGLPILDALPRLQSLLYDADIKSSQFADISLCFKSTTICEVRLLEGR